MKIFITLLSVILCSHLQAQPQKFTYGVKPSKEGFDEMRLHRLDSFILVNIVQNKIPNTVTFIARDGKVIHNKAFGWKNIETKQKVDVQTIFRNASQTKAITSVALMILYERGYFQLNDPVSKYLPEFKEMKILDSLYTKDFSFKSHPAKKEITIKHLLSHTSGIMYDHPLTYNAKIPLYNSLSNVVLKDVISSIAKLPLLHEPGEKFSYGLNTDVLGYLIEKLSGKSLDKFFKDEIFIPLGMRDTYFYLPEEKKNRLVELYQTGENDDELKISDNESNRFFAVKGVGTYFSGGAGLVGTIEDYAKFCQMLLNGGRFNNNQILGRKTIETMLRNQIGDNYIWDNENKFGLGFELITEKSTSSQLGSPGSFKWGGMYTTDYLIDPKEKLIILYYTNVSPNKYWNLNHYNRTLTYQALVK